MMRVLLINHFPLQGSGSGIYTLNIASELYKQGHQVCVIDIDNRIESATYPFLRHTILCDSSRHKHCDLAFNFPCFTTHPRSNTTFYDLTEEQIAAYVQAFVSTTRSVAGCFHPDVIHAQHLWVAPYAALQSKVPYVVTAHGTDLMGFRKDVRYHHYALDAARHAAAVITISQQVDFDVRDLYKLPAHKLHLIANGFDDSVFYPMKMHVDQIKKQLGLPAHTKLISFVGKFTDFKGIDILIQAMQQVQSEVADVHLALAGDGELRPQMEALASELKLTGIHFLGHQNQTQVAMLYSAADVSIVPSRVEPFGLVAIEAMACGTPVVATDAGGLPDFVNNEVGALVPMENPDALAEAIIAELAQDTKQTKGVYAARYALNTYSWKHSLQQVMTLYQQAIQN
jgi:glycosyltransferase involved in cell wall biosynthesis